MHTKLIISFLRLNKYYIDNVRQRSAIHHLQHFHFLDMTPYVGKQTTYTITKRNANKSISILTLISALLVTLFMSHASHAEQQFTNNNTVFQENFIKNNSISILRKAGWKFDNGFTINTASPSNRPHLYFKTSSKKKATALSPHIEIHGENIIHVDTTMRVLNVEKGEKEWLAARIQIQAYNKHKVPIHTWTIASMYGNSNWESINSKLLTPIDTSSVRIIVDINQTKGSLSLDSISIRMDDKPSPITAILKDETNRKSDLLPVPKHEHLSNQLAIFKAIALFPKANDKAIKRELNNFFSGHNIPIRNHTTSSKDLIVNAVDTDIELLKRINNTNISKILSIPQSYLLHIDTNSNGQTQVIAMSGSKEGRSYAINTFKQLVAINNGIASVPLGYIIDYPYLKTRGIVFGDLKRWFNTKKKSSRTLGSIIKAKPYRELAKETKINFAWLTGWKGFYSRNIRTLSTHDLTELKRFHNDCNNLNITASVGFRPYKQTSGIDNNKGGVIYSSSKHIDGIVNNYKLLYKLGFRNFHMSFDDQEPSSVLQYHNDKKAFPSPGSAHYTFISNVYKTLKEHFKDIKFRVITMAYHEPSIINSPDYIRELNKLPNEIEFVWVGNNKNSASKYKDSVGDRDLIYWSNYYQDNFDKIPDTQLIYPFIGIDLSQLDFVTSMVFQPPDFNDQLNSVLSWYTTADFMWRGDQYNKQESLERAISKTLGSKMLLNVKKMYNRDISKPPVNKTTHKEINSANIRKLILHCIKSNQCTTR